MKCLLVIRSHFLYCHPRSHCQQSSVLDFVLPVFHSRRCWWCKRSRPKPWTQWWQEWANTCRNGGSCDHGTCNTNENGVCRCITLEIASRARPARLTWSYGCRPMRSRECKDARQQRKKVCELHIEEIYENGSERRRVCEEEQEVIVRASRKARW